MSVDVIITILTITGAIIAAIIQGNLTATKLASDFEKKLAVTETKLDHLYNEIEKSNDLSSRVPVIEEQIKVINHRIDDLEKHVEV